MECLRQNQNIESNNNECSTWVIREYLIKAKNIMEIFHFVKYITPRSLFILVHCSKNFMLIPRFLSESSKIQWLTFRCKSKQSDKNFVNLLSNEGDSTPIKHYTIQCNR